MGTNHDKHVEEEIKSNRMDLTFEELLTKLMPDNGPAGTLEGEILRAVNRISYRYYNNGDLPTRGYGIETSGHALMFLMYKAPRGMHDVFEACETHQKGKFETALDTLQLVITKWVNEQFAHGELKKDNIDMCSRSFQNMADARWKEKDSD